jgi:lipopolysaccharide/colanic/teichoic acid biosynthesis glycosyltransferase
MKLGTLADTGVILKRLRPDLAIMPIALGRNGAAESLECCRTFGVPLLTNEGLPLLGADWYGDHEFLGTSPNRGASWLGRRGDRLLKRALDICISVVGCGFTLLVLPFVAIAIWWEDRGPVFFRQQYMATPTTKGTYLKFRSMSVNAGSMLQNDARLRKQFEETFKLKDDPRVTRVGAFLRRYSIDELPEFFSVLRGTLSVVGPRTLSATEAPRYGQDLEKVLSVLPGITGFWQVMGRQTTTYDERIQMDLFYLERHSFWFDLFIFIKTIWKVVAAEGAY